MNIITVQYESRKKPGAFGGNDYTYIADQTYQVGDVVAAPTRFGTSLALVTAINIDAKSIPEKLRGVLLHITGDPIPQQVVAPEAQQYDL